MILPNNGRIVIVDDKLNEAAPLIQILSKKRIPFNYYSGERIADFPENPDQNKIRILFLDLNIIEAQKEIKTVISTLDPIIKAIVPSNPNPYLLVIWSKKGSEYADALKDHINVHIQDRKPIRTIFLHKNDYFDYNDGVWVPQNGCIEKITETLSTELTNISLLRNLISWENIVHQKAAETISEFSSFHQMDDNWDKNTKAIMYRLAKAVIGNDDIGTSTNEFKLAKAFLSVNSFLADKIENEVESFQLGHIEGIPNSDGDAPLTSSIAAKINSTLHTCQKPFLISQFEQGNVYEIPDEDNMIERIIWDKLFTPPNGEKLTEIRASHPRLVQLDITPVCDYSQDKRYIRVIYGVIIRPEYAKYFRSQFYYVCPVMKNGNEEIVLLFDFRHIKTITKHYVTGRNIVPSLKFRREICTDIQSQLANQVNRPGISSV
ncbi:MAG: hypothetical protein ACOYXT_21930 [Bacteroidota bacterium]